MPDFGYFCGTEQFHAAFAWSWLGALAIRTRRARIATEVTCPLFRYHPGVVALAAATLDRLSGGRFAIGVGTGEGINERPLGWEFPGNRERRARMAEAIAIMRRRAARDADRSKPAVVARRWSILAQDEDEAWQALAAWRGLRVEGRLDEVDPSVLRARADAMDRREIIGKYAWARTPTELVEIYRPLVEVGADIVTLQVTSIDQDATIKLPGKEVLPALRRLAPSA
jgi:alkanesulfonate monooxygenase SsuD/methylene tetrahydromethanopterin reductase-like flavin-dependent oxidoreductase (luciferase family)